MDVKALYSEGKLRQEAIAGHPATRRDKSSVSESDVSFRFFPADPPLSFFVDYFYISSLSASFMTVVRGVRLPELEAQLVFAIEEGQAFPGGVWISSKLRASLFLQSAHLQMVPIPDTIRAAVGVSFRPAGLRLLFERGAGDLGEAARIALQDIWGADATRLLERLVEQATPLARLDVLRQCLRSRLPALRAPNPGITRAIELMRGAGGEISNESLARALGCTPRTLHRSMVLEVGLNPKSAARILRVRHAFSLLDQPHAKARDVAATSAFSDQAHMTREFRTLLGQPPAQLLRAIQATTIPAYRSERELNSTGLLVLPPEEPRQC